MGRTQDISKCEIPISEDEILAAIRVMRFGEEPRCIYCGSDTVIKWGYIPHTNRQRYLCKKCGATFNDLTGTPLENSKISLRDWITIAYMFFRRGMKVSDIARVTNHSPRTVIRVINLVKENSLLQNLLRKLASERVSGDRS